jgi:hypothetical protein
MKIVLPAQTVNIDTPTGLDPIWYERLQALTAFANLFSEINFAAMPNGFVMVWDATAKKFRAGAN